MSQDTSNVVAQARNVDLPEEMHSTQTHVSLIASINEGSITYPYRSLVKEASFPQYHFMAKPGNQTEAFSGSLRMLGHGTPLWNARGNLARPREHLKSGISIGDVGFLSYKGEFEYCFNIFQPQESPVQVQCPSNMIPLQAPLESELSTTPMYFPPGTALVSHGIEATTLSTSPLDIQFTVNAREGGIFVLPDGASREDLISTARIREYIQKHVLEWYILLNQGFDSIVNPNGTLYVITGTDKAASWASCLTYTRETQRHRVLNPSITIYRGARGDALHRWDSNSRRELVYRWSRKPEEEQVGTCALFIRGIRFAVNDNDWTRHILHYRTPEEIPYCVIRTMPVLGLRATIQTLKETRRSYKQKLPAEAGDCVRAVFHPLDVLLHLLLNESPSASVAFLEDKTWCAVADQSDASRANIVRLLIQILETHESSVKDGVVTLVPRSAHSQVLSQPGQPNNWPLFPASIRRQYLSWRDRRRALKRLSKVFPGSGIPSELLEYTRLDDLY